MNNEEYTLKPTIKAFYESLEHSKMTINPEDYIGTGYKSLDKSIAGYKKGKLTLITSFPLMGKTSFLNNSILNITKDKSKNILVFNTDHRKIDILQELIAIKSGMHIGSVKSSPLEKYQMEFINTVCEELEDLNCMFGGVLGHSETSIMNDIEECSKYADPDIIFVDSLGRIMDTRENEIHKINEEIWTLNRIAQDINKPIVALLDLPSNESDMDYKYYFDLKYFRRVRISIDEVYEILYLTRPSWFKIDFDEDGNILTNHMIVYALKNVLRRNNSVFMHFDASRRIIKEVD